jgi:Glycosyltransferase family 87
MTWAKRTLLLAAVLLGCLVAAPWQAAAQSTPVTVPKSLDRAPAGYSIAPRQALRLAERRPEVARERRAHPGLRPKVVIPQYFGDRRYEVAYRVHGRGEVVVDVHVGGRSGRVIELWTGPQADNLLARGYDPAIGRALNNAYVWLPLALLFLAPFFDPRRPFRMLHLDLLLLLGFGVSQHFFNRGDVELSVPLVYPLLAYLLARMLQIGFGRSRGRAGPLLPWAKPRLLVIGLVLLVAFRVGLNAVDSHTVDVGQASVFGADRIEHGVDLYQRGNQQDTYGPLMYLAYVPFEALFPDDGPSGFEHAARAAAITFDLLTLAGLMLLGTRLRAGREGRTLGLALAYAWAAYPFTLYALQANTNDTLIAALLVGLLLALRSPPLRGLVLGVATAAKFAPLALAPLLARGLGGRRPRDVALFAAALAGSVALAVFVYLPDGGLRELWDATIGFQLGRPSPFSLWGLHPSLGWAQTLVKAGAALLAVTVFFVPRELDLRRLAALGAAVLIAVELTATHWFYFYIVWFAPFVLAAIFGAYDLASPGRSLARRGAGVVERGGLENRWPS